MALPALQERIEQELESNIALETVEPGLELEGLEEDAVHEELELERREEERAAREGERELVVGEGDESADFERLDGMEQAFGNELYGEDSTPSMQVVRDQNEIRDGKIDALNNTPSRGESLVEQLLKQWMFVETDEETQIVGQVIIGYIGDDGLLDADLETIREQTLASTGVDYSLELLERVLKVVQHELEPPGIAARSRSESLILQIDAMDEPETEKEEQELTDARRLIDEFFTDLLENRLPQIEKQSGIDIGRIQDAKEWMARLELSPGRVLVQENVRPIVPDVRVEYDSERDAYIAFLADDPLLHLRVSPSYEALAKDAKADAETRKFVDHNVRNAAWLIDAINQRKNTMLRVVNVVITRQRDFFDHGPQHLKPLPMLEVAEQLDIHVATVSRAVADKWMETPRGFFPLRRFFSGGLETSEGKDMSWEAVKEMVREIVDNEDSTSPLSDQAIANALAERGVEIARRTVVKYREQLGIPKARIRKDHSN